jgi:hypothetical protein
VLDVVGGSGRCVSVGLQAGHVLGDILEMPCTANCVLRVISWVAAPIEPN